MHASMQEITFNSGDRVRVRPSQEDAIYTNGYEGKQGTVVSVSTDGNEFFYDLNLDGSTLPYPLQFAQHELLPADA